MEPNLNIRMALLKVRPLTSTTCRRPSHSGDDFRKTACSAKRTNWPVNRPFPAKSRTTTLGPFGEVIRETGPMAKVNPIRFSTKYADDESDLLYYGCRYYKSSTGTWVNRDPMQEHGGRNIYVLVANNPVGHIDLLGQELYVINNYPTDIGCGSYRFERGIYATENFVVPVYIIQEITFSGKMYSYFAGTVVPSQPYSDQYWEAFGPYYDEEEAVATFDVWSSKPGLSNFGNSMGSITEIGVAKVFSLGITGYLGTLGSGPVGGVGWWPPADRGSGELPSTKQEPSWWNNPASPPSDGPVTSSATLIWNCSCAGASYTLMQKPLSGQ